jgi:hypothetical protein
VPSDCGSPIPGPLLIIPAPQLDIRSLRKAGQNHFFGALGGAESECVRPRLGALSLGDLFKNATIEMKITKVLSPATLAALAVPTALAIASAPAVPATHASPGGAGTLNDWIAAVCAPATFADGGSGGGPIQPHATWRGGCVASTDATTIFVGRYASVSDAAYDLTHLSGFYHTKNVVGSTTAAQMADGTGIVFTAPRLPKSGPVPQRPTTGDSTPV